MSSSLISRLLEQLTGSPGSQLPTAGCPGLREFLLTVPGVRPGPLAGRFRPPGEAAIRRILEPADADHPDAAITSWLASPAVITGRRAAAAVYGKALFRTRHCAGDGQAAHLLAAKDQQARTVLAQAAADGRTSEITRSEPLPDPWT